MIEFNESAFLGQSGQTRNLSMDLSCHALQLSLQFFLERDFVIGFDHMVVNLSPPF